MVFPIFKRVLFFGNNQCIEIHRISSRKEDAMALWISMIIFCMTTEARLHVPHNVNKSKSISRTKFVKVLLWNEFLPYTHNFIAGLVRSMNIAVLSGRKSQHGDSGLTPFIQNSMQIEKKKDLLEKLSAFEKRGVGYLS